MELVEGTETFPETTTALLIMISYSTKDKFIIIMYSIIIIILNILDKNDACGLFKLGLQCYLCDKEGGRSEIIQF